MVVDTVNKVIDVTLDPEKYPAEIRYTTDGSIPTTQSPLYTGSIQVKDSAHIVAAIFENGQLMGIPTEKAVDYHRGINKPVHYNNQLYKGYMAGGVQALVDGYQGGVSYGDGLWQGYLDNLDCVVDMEEITDVNNVSIRFMQITGPGVYQPEQVELLTSIDGENFISQGFVPTTVSADEKNLTFQTYKFSGPWTTCYIRLVAKRANPGFLFTDEIVIW
ncbi:MAG: chitobiase/beta-hexosaminidase C-terminal domain-containing protein [Tannerellaceae bacterium]|nr:chitobiase/beta-hexosaminidase C-terminal domain-containing protein [Tannerellaceae bacterium]